MKTHQDILREILKSTGWSQQQLAIKLGVSFPTVNYWLNGKVVPRKSMQKRIRNLYLARDIPYEGPVYITLLLTDTSETIKVGDKILLFKTDEDDDTSDYEVFGIKRDDLTTESIDVKPQNLSIANLTPADLTRQIPIATTKDTVAKGTKPAFRIYDRVRPGAYARIMFTLHNSAIAVVEDFGPEI